MQIYLDHAILVHAQGETLNNIEIQVPLWILVRIIKLDEIELNQSGWFGFKVAWLILWKFSIAFTQVSKNLLYLVTYSC